MNGEEQLDLRVLVRRIERRERISFSHSGRVMMNNIITRAEGEIETQPERRTEALLNFQTFIEYMVSRGVREITEDDIEETRVQLCPLWPIC